MTITIDKQLTITIDGSDVSTLRAVCEMARRYKDDEVKRNRLDPRSGDERVAGEWRGRELHEIEEFMQQIFDA